MNNQLDALENILEDFHQGRNNITTLNASIHEIKTIAETIYNEIYLLQENGKNPEVLIKHLLSGLTKISDRCYHTFASPTDGAIDDKRKNALELFLININRLFTHLTEYYRPYIDIEINPPVHYKMNAISGISQKINKVIDQLNNSSIDISIVNIVVNYLKNSTGITISSLRELTYFKDFVLRLASLNLDERNDGEEKRLVNELIYLNFNSIPFIRQYIAKIQKPYNDVDSYQEDLQHAIVALKELEQQPERQNHVYDSEAPSLKQSLTKAINEEINCLIKLQKDYQRRMRIPELAQLQHFYFKVSITIEQLIFFFRLMIESNVLIAKKKDHLYEFIHRHIGTNTKDDLSKGNMRNKYSQPSNKTIQRVKALLNDMLRLIQEDYQAR